MVNEKKPFLTYKHILYGVIVGLFGVIINIGIMYFSNTITFKCYGNDLHNTTEYSETYYKSNLSEYKLICNKPNPFIYNDNSGLGIFFPNERTKQYSKELDMEKTNYNLSLNTY